MGIAREMGRLIRLSYNGHITIGELTGYVYALDKARAAESALTIEAENAKRAPAISSKIDVSIITVPSGHFISAEQADQIQSGEFLQRRTPERQPRRLQARCDHPTGRG